MLRSGNDLKGLAIRATDGEVGKVDQFLFDDASWTVRYMVVNTAGWLLKELVLVSPSSIRGVDWVAGQVQVGLTREQVEQAPPIAHDAPVSREMELEMASYYQYQPYWAGPGLWGGAAVPFAPGLAAGPEIGPVATPEPAPLHESATEPGDYNLRSTREVGGYAIRANDGDIGAVSDFLMDDETWAIRYLVVDTGGWWSGKQVLLAPLWATAVSWEDRVVEMDLTRDQVRGGPEFDRERMTRDDEQLLYQHYRRRGYWEKLLI